MKIDVRCPADPIWSLNNDGPFIRWMCTFNYTMLNRLLLVCPILDAMRGLGSPNTSRENRVGSLSTREPGEAPLPHSNILWFQNAQFNNPRNRMMINLTVSNNVPIWRNLCAKNLNDFRRFCWVAQPTVMVDQLRLLFPDMDGSSFASFASAGDEAETAPAVCFPRTEENVGYTYGGFQKHGYPKMDGLSWKSIYKWMMWGHPHFRKPPYDKYTLWSLLKLWKTTIVNWKIIIKKKYN